MRKLHKAYTMAWISFVLALLISSSSAFLSSLTTTTTTTTRRNQRTSSVTQIHAEPHTQFTPLSCENETIESVPNRTSSVPFPRSSYHLSRLEDNIQYQFVSFIDHFDDSYTQVSRLVEPRRYARSNQFYGRKPTTQPPTIDDVACPPSLFGPVAAFLAWNRLPARIIVGTLAYLTFPIVVDIMESYTTVDVIQDSAAELSFYDRLLILATGNEQGAENGIVLSIDEDNRDRLATLVNLYLPGISIVLGTYFSLTLDILYRRFSSLQETVALEASTLAYCFQLLLSLFDKDRKNLIESAQSVADQVHVLVKESRGKEMMRTVYNDPYSDILRIVQNYSRKTGTLSQPQDASLVGVIRDCVRQLYSLRTQRLNYEANGLAPAHFDLMTFLAGLLLVGIALGTGTYT